MTTLIEHFEQHGFEVPVFHCELLKQVDGYHIGYVLELFPIPLRWDSRGLCNHSEYNLTLKDSK